VRYKVSIDYRILISFDNWKVLKLHFIVPLKIMRSWFQVDIIQIVNWRKLEE